MAMPPSWQMCLTPESFDVIVCHNLLEYVDDPGAVLSSASRTLRDSSSIISVLVRNQAGEVLKAGIKDGDLAAAEQNLAAEWADESLYGGKARLFTAESLRAMLAAASLGGTVERGVRVISDYLPARFHEITSTNGFLSWSASSVSGRSLWQSPAIRSAWHIAQSAP